MRKLAVLLAFTTGIAFAASESATQALAQLPPLPKAAAKDLDCSLGETTQKKVTEIGARETAAAQAAASSPMSSLTDAQMAAVQAMTEPAFNSCPTDVLQEAQGWSNPAEEKLAARLAQVEATRAREHEAWCNAQTSAVVCEPNPAIVKRAVADATAAGTQFLKDVQPGYAKFAKQAAACATLREPAVVAAGSVKGPFKGLVGGAHSMNWWMVGQIAEAHSKACKAARDAAQRYLPQ